MMKIPVKDALELARDNYQQYSAYVAQGRAYPNILDGCKSAYKRAIYGMYLHNNHKVVKVAELAAHALPYHPHPTSISGVIVQLGDKGNKLKLMETQGNWGDSSKKIQPSADRYIGGYLSPLAESLLCDSIEYCNYVKGEIDKNEPEALPALLPLCFINGLEGIPSGLPKLNIPTIDIDGMIDYYIEILAKKDLSHTPKKFPKPSFDCNVISTAEDWNNIMRTGKGTIRLAPVMEISDNTITITALPSCKTMDHIRKILEKELLMEKVDIRDESTSKTCIVIEKVPYKQISMHDVYNKLYHKLETSHTCNMAFFSNDKIFVPCGFDKVVKSNLNYVINTHKNRISHELSALETKIRVLEVIEQLKSNDDIKRLAGMNNTQAVDFIANGYFTTKEVAEKVLQKPLSYLTKAHLDELISLKAKYKELENDNSDIFEFLIKKYRLLKREIHKVLKEQK